MGHELAGYGALEMLRPTGGCIWSLVWLAAGPVVLGASVDLIEDGTIPGELAEGPKMSGS